jgi:hypothetical protein
VKIDYMLNDWPELRPARPETSTALTLSDAELLTLAVMSALMGFTSSAAGCGTRTGIWPACFPP